MRTLILYYSYTGNCRKQAQKLKNETPESDIYEVKDTKHAGMARTFMIKCPKAARRKTVPIQKITADLDAYDRYIIVAPIWNSYPAPEFNSIISCLLSGREVEVYMCSGGGETEKSRQGTCDLIENAGFTLIGYHDVRTTGMI